MRRNRLQRNGIIPALFSFLAVCTALTFGPAARAFEAAEVRAMIASPRAASAFPGQGGIWLGRERSVRIDGAGNAEAEEHLIAQVFRPEWAERRFRPYVRTYWSERAYLQVLSARVWRSLDDWEDLPPDGVVDSLVPSAQGVPSCAYFRRRIFHFPELREGQVVEIRLKWILPVDPDNPNLNSLREVFGAAEPVAEQRFSLTQPAAAQPKFRELGAPLLRRNEVSEGWFTRSWITGNLPALAAGLWQTPWSRLPQPGQTVGSKESQLLFSSFQDWEQISERYGLLWETAWNAGSAEMDSLVSAELRREPEPDARARSLANFVQEQVRTVPVPVPYMDLRPQPAAEILKQRAGSEREKTCLLVALLRAAGIRAFPVLVRNHEGAWDADFPCPAQLDRYVVVSRVPGRDDLWLDPTGAEPSPPSGMGLALHGAEEGPDQGDPAGLVPFPGF